jgi:hypothetical protein
MDPLGFYTQAVPKAIEWYQEPISGSSDQGDVVVHQIVCDAYPLVICQNSY